MIFGAKLKKGRKTNIIMFYNLMIDYGLDLERDSIKF